MFFILLENEFLEPTFRLIHSMGPQYANYTSNKSIGKVKYALD